MALSAYCDGATTFEGRNRITAGAKLLRSHLGLATYVGSRSLLTNTRIGRFSCIGPEVQTIIGAHPTRDFVSIHPAFFSTKRQAGFTFVPQELYPEFGTGRTESDCLVEIGSDVWIGHGARLMQGIKISHGAVIAAGSIVTKDVAPYMIVAGVPARPLRARFSDATISRLLATHWWELDFDQIARLAPHFSSAESLLQAMDRLTPARAQP